MSSINVSNSSGYGSASTLNTIGEKDQPDIANVSISNIDRIVFDHTDQERPPFNLSCCCHSRVERSLLVVIFHYSVLLAVVFFCISYLAICDSDSKFASGILALLSACVGHVLPGPKT